MSEEKNHMEHHHTEHKEHHSAHHGTHQGDTPHHSIAGSSVPSENPMRSVSPLMPASDETFKMPKFDIKDFNFGVAFKNFLNIVKLDKKAIAEIADDEKGNANALIFLLAAMIIGNLCPLLFGIRILGTFYQPTVLDTIVTFLFGIISLIINLGVTTFAAVRFFKGQGTMAQYFRVHGLMQAGGIILVLGYIFSPLLFLLTFLFGIWILVMTYIAIKTVFKLDTQGAVFTFLIFAAAALIWGGIFNFTGLNPANRAMKMNMTQNMSGDFSQNYR